MIALYTFVPLYCPSCGIPIRLDRIDKARSGKYQAYQSQQCSICGVTIQLAMKADLLRAATASGGDLVEYFIEDDDEVESNGKPN